MKVIGITGGVGAGKTEILSFLNHQYGAVLLIADRIAEELMAPGTDCMKRIQNEFPCQVFQKDGTLDRVGMASLIFTKPEYRRKLNQIVHPAVKKEIIQRLRQEEEKKTTLVIIEAALIVEEHYDALCDEIWYIDTSEENRIARLQQSRGYTEEKSRQIIRAQLSRQEFLQHALVTIDNNGTMEETIEQIRKILN